MQCFGVRRLGLVLFALFMAGMAHTARAQWAVYGQGTGATLNLNNTNNAYGGTFGFFRSAHVGAFSYGPDLRGTMTFGSNHQGQFTDSRLDTGVVAVRAAWAPSGSRFTPYAEGALGIGYFRGGIGITRQDKTSATEQVMGGVDLRVATNFDWRVAEFTYGRFVGQSSVIHPYIYSTGVVFHIP